MSNVLRALRRPVIAAPMAGGPSTPALAAAVSDAGGLGFLAAGYLTVDQLAEDIRATRSITERLFGVNIFAPVPEPVDPIVLAAYTERLRPDAERWGVELGAPVGGDDAYWAKLRMVLDGNEEPVAVVSFAFGLPAREIVDALHARGTEAWATVNHPSAVSTAAALGVDAIVVQGTEAGAHRGGADDADDYGVLPLLRLAAARLGDVEVPLVAAGGVIDGPSLAAVLVAGASAAQVGTAFLRCPEAGTSSLHRQVLARDGDTRLTRAFSGRRARGVVNAFMGAHDEAAPAAYPHVYHLTRPLLAAARAAADPATVNVWAGQAHALSRDVPAAQVVEDLTRGALATIEALRKRTARWREA
jgi:nitronate monooxygenase